MGNICALGITSVTITMSAVNSSTKSLSSSFLFSNWSVLVYSRCKSPSPFCQQDARSGPRSPRVGTLFGVPEASQDFVFWKNLFVDRGDIDTAGDLLVPGYPSALESSIVIGFFSSLAAFTLSPCQVFF